MFSKFSQFFWTVVIYFVLNFRKETKFSRLFYFQLNMLLFVEITELELRERDEWHIYEVNLFYFRNNGARFSIKRLGS